MVKLAGLYFFQFQSSNMDKKRVVCFVLLSENDEVYGSDSTMSFFAILDDPEQMNQKKTVNSSIQPLLPFTGLKSSYDDCSFASFEDQVYVIGGSTLPWHLQHGTKEIKERVNHKYKDYLKQHSFESLEHLPSNRVLRFEAQKCLDSLFQNNQMEKVEFVELDDVSNHSQTYWGTRPSLTTARKLFHILHLRGKLYAIGGYHDGEHSGKRTSLIEVYDQGVWAPLKLDRCSQINPSLFVSVAIEKDNMILIGSNESFFKIDVGKGSVEKWKGVECPEKFVLGCFQQPGFVINKQYALWYDDSFSCIRLLNLITEAYFIFIFHFTSQFYAPIEEMLGAAFAMDVHVPQKKNLSVEQCLFFGSNLVFYALLCTSPTAENSNIH
ncbi:hypothetical protein Leryth_023939 [Lithospermum erythrorhizon]|nr:hypothetical protein Leryth_023939 [Lithospermum erythrorhizon]